MRSGAGLIRAPFARIRRAEHRAHMLTDNSIGVRDNADSANLDTIEAPMIRLGHRVANAASPSRAP